MRVSNDVFAQICAEMDMLEQSGKLEEMFEWKPRAPDSQTNAETFIESLVPGMKLYKSTFKKILGYEITTPGFAEGALTRLESLGCRRAWKHYEAVRSEWQQDHDAQIKSAAQWYRGQCVKEFENLKRKVVNESRKQQRTEQLKADLQQKSDRELLTLLQRLRQSERRAAV